MIIGKGITIQRGGTHLLVVATANGSEEFGNGFY